MKAQKIAPLIVTIFLMACSGGGGGGGGGAQAVSQTTTISLSFTRVKSSSPNPFIVSAEVLQGGGPLTGQSGTVQVTLGQGSLGLITESSPGVYQFTVTPSQTGEHPVTVSLSGTTVTRTALVASEVHPDWGQPMAVSGLVNTEGYEDGVTITKDGEYLFVQYGALYASAFFLFDTPRASGGCGGDRPQGLQEAVGAIASAPHAAPTPGWMMFWDLLQVQSVQTSLPIVSPMASTSTAPHPIRLALIRPPTSLRRLCFMALSARLTELIGNPF
jgi:hypothetical protein